MVRLASPIAHSFVVTIDDGGRLGVPEIGQDVSLVEGDAGGGKDAGDFGLDDKGYNHPQGCGWSGRRQGG